MGSRAPGVNVVELVTKVLQEMQRLEGNIKKADDQRARAESELLEVAVLKQTSDDALDSLTKYIGDKVGELSSISNRVKTISASNAELSKVASQLETICKDINNKIDKRSIENDKQESFRRTSIMVQKIDLSNIPPPPSAPTIGPPPVGPPPTGGPTRATRSIRSGKARESTLLSQIRKGTSLNKLIMQQFKKKGKKVWEIVV